MEYPTTKNKSGDTCLINQNILNTLIENISDPAFVIDSNSKYIHFNNSYEQWVKIFFGVEISYDTILYDLLNKEERFNTKQIIDKAFKSKIKKTAVCWENWQKEKKEFLLSADPILNEQGEKFGALVTIKDNNKDIFNSHSDIYKTIFDNSIVGKSLTTIDGIIRVNSGFCKILGYAEEELNKLNWTQITHKDDIEGNKKILSDIFANKKKSERWTKRYIHKDGRIIWVDITTTLIRDEKKHPLFFVTEIIDITEQKKSEIALTESEEKFRKAIYNAPFPIMIHSEDGQVELINEEWTKITGYDLKDIPTIALWAERAYGERKGLIIQEIDRLYKLSEKVDEGEYLIKTNLGNTRNWHFSSTPLGRNSDGERLSMSMAVDVTETKIAQEVTIKNKERLNRAELASKSGNWELHLDNGTIYASRGARKLYGIENAIWLYKDIKEIPLPEYRHALDQALKDLIEEGKPYNVEFEIKSANTGEIKNIHSTAIYDPTSKVIFGVITDITDKKAAERDLKENEIKFEAMFDSSPIAFVIYEMDGRISKVNSAYCQLTGYSENELVGKTTIDLNLTNPKRREKMLDQIRLSGGMLENFEIELLRKDKTTRNILISSKNITIDTKQFRFGINIDVTELRNVEKKLRENEQNLSNLFASMSEMVVFHEMIKNENGEFVNYRILDCNDAFSQITGIEKADAIGKLATEVYQTEMSPYLEEYSTVCKTGKMLEHKTYFAPLDKHFIISAIPLSENQFSTVTTDITDIQTTQEAIIANNKELESYIYVASHDLRSPLVNIQGFSQRLKKHSEALKQCMAYCNTDTDSKNDILDITEQKIPKDLNYIQTNVVKMDKLINGLLQVSRTGRISMKFQNIDMNKLINSVISSYNFQLSEIKAKVTIHDLQNCYGDENLLNQLFSNIISNAIKYKSPDRELQLEISSTLKFTKVIYSVKDNGIGISPRHIEKIWDVFFRIDSCSQTGDGLGLSLAKRIVDKHKGKIWVESEEKRESTFYIELHKTKFTEV